MTKGSLENKRHKIPHSRTFVCTLGRLRHAFKIDITVTITQREGNVSNPSVIMIVLTALIDNLDRPEEVQVRACQ